uniref:Cilia- and flagella-associated protein 36 n=1 Tax=Strongyloides venezuelensis TaxID=75913 RepID=A0A0K0FQ00_STRVS
MNQLLSDPYECEKFDASEFLENVEENGVLYGYGKWPRDPNFIYHPMDNTETIFRQHVKYVFDNFAKGHTYDELPKNLSDFNSMIHIFYDIMVLIMSRMGDDLLKHYRFTIEFDKLNRLENNVLGMLLPAIMPYSEHEEFEDDLLNLIMF